MIKLNPYNTNYKPSFGSTTYTSNIIPNENYNHGLCHSDFFIRRAESSPISVMEYLIKKAKSARKTEMRIWGCSDLSTFLTKMMVLNKLTSQKEAQKLFSDIELIDIEPKIIKRAQSGLVGATQIELDMIKEDCKVNPFDYLTPVQNDNFFFRNEDDSIIAAMHDLSDITTDEIEIKPYRYSKKLLNGATIRVGDIREDVKEMPKSKPSTLRIFEFANGWYFLKKEKQAELAANIAKKLNLGDVLIVGNVELSLGIKKILNNLGFKQVDGLKEIFERDCVPPTLNDFSSFRVIKKLLGKLLSLK